MKKNNLLVASRLRMDRPIDHLPGPTERVLDFKFPGVEEKIREQYKALGLMDEEGGGGEKPAETKAPAKAATPEKETK